ncbi:MAG: deoxyribodipyrimidine photo-lyase [Chromatiaceae bacterium]|nr:MAG: deoxyribodipyrimidine photo-lyase [Chromatiaceae bacterium]
MTTALIWFRRDLRLADNPALMAALEQAERIVPVYIHAPEEEGDWTPGAASRWWLHHSLAQLGQDLAELGAPLVIRSGPSLETLQDLIRETGASHVHWNRLYEPDSIRRDTRIKQVLQAQGVQTRSFNGALLLEPWAVQNRSGDPYRVFTPYWKACQAQGALDVSLQPRPGRLVSASEDCRGEALGSLGLLPTIPWDAGLAEAWTPGEEGAHEALEGFLAHALADYGEARNLPDRVGTSRLSPHLHFGEISPRQVVHACHRAVAEGRHRGADASVKAFLGEVGWREFGHHLLFHFPHTPLNPLDTRFEDFPWPPRDDDALQAWQQGRTGLPIVDAGMRELWTTGWMHNRVRMITASLLTKNLLIHWREGARWFWDTLVDADLASNTLGWQWTAGCGADAAPYFRVFNPVLQGERFDPKGDYVRRWVPELKNLPDKYLHKPWQAPDSVWRSAGIRPGRDYPRPIVDLAVSRREALAAWEILRQSA